MSWYKENIEEPIRDIVKYLRDNGVNTECSCGHDMHIQCQLILDGEINRIHYLLYNYFYDKKKKINYEIDIKLKVEGGHQTINSIYITFEKENVE